MATECRDAEIKELLPEHAAGKLRGGALARMEGHLESCADCRGEMALLRMLAEEPAPEPPEPAEAFWEEFPGRVYREVQREKAAGNSGRRRWSPLRLLGAFSLPRRVWVPVAAAVSVAIVASALIWAGSRQPRETPYAGTPPRSDYVFHGPEAPLHEYLSSLDESGLREVASWSQRELASVGGEIGDAGLNGPRGDYSGELSRMNEEELRRFSTMLDAWEKEVSNET